MNPNPSNLFVLAPNTPQPVATITLANVGTYFVWGEGLVLAEDMTNPNNPTFVEMTSTACYLSGQGVSGASGFQNMTYGGTLSPQAVVVASTANTTVTLNCQYGGLVTNNANVEAGAVYQALTAIQVQ